MSARRVSCVTLTFLLACGAALNAHDAGNAPDVGNASDVGNAPDVGNPAGTDAGGLTDAGRPVADAADAAAVLGRNDDGEVVLADGEICGSLGAGGIAVQA
jgi:hypothetical protein